MTTRQYIGARYVPVFADPVEWSDERQYEHLMMVQHNGETYISQQAVPIGIQLPDDQHGEESNDYWVHMSNWNAQVETYRQEVLQYNNRISTLEDDLPIADFDSTNTVKAYIDGEIEDIEEIIPASDFDSTNTVKAYIDGEIDGIEEIIPASDFDSINTVKSYIDSEINSIPMTHDYVINEKLLICSIEPPAGTYFQGSYFDAENSILYIAAISNGTGVVTDEYGYIIKYDTINDTQIGISSLIHIYHANSIDMYNGYLYLTTLDNFLVKVNPSDLTIVGTVDMSTIGLFAGFTVDPERGLAFLIQGSQNPTLNTLSKIGTTNKFMVFNGVKWNLSGLEYNQGIHARKGVIALPVWRVEEGKSFINLYDYNYNLKQIITFDDYFEIEDVTVTTSYIYFTTSTGRFYRTPYSFTGNISLNAFAYNERTYLYLLDRNIATTEHPYAHSSVNITTGIPVNTHSVPGGRMNGELLMRVSMFDQEYDFRFTSFNPNVTKTLYIKNIVFTHISGVNLLMHYYLIYTIDPNAGTLTMNKTATKISQLDLGSNTYSEYTMNELITENHSFIPVTFPIEIVGLIYTPSIAGGNIMSGGCTYEL